MINLYEDEEAFLFLLVEHYPDIAKIMDNNLTPSRKSTVYQALLVETDDTDAEVIHYNGKAYYLFFEASRLDGESSEFFFGLENSKYRQISVDFEKREFLPKPVTFKVAAHTYKEHWLPTEHYK